ncbi:MAG: sigma 54-interacting transcriptional regulator [Phycisphaeraceae bacterium]|nr:sigma 54-interacting transcriptional regulator [Phycisphaeraceae bacterium]
MSSVPQTNHCQQCQWGCPPLSVDAATAAAARDAQAPLPPVTCSILDSVIAAIFTVDLDWRITSFNQEAERITGVKRHEAIGQHWADVVRQADADSDCALRQSLRTGKPMVDRHSSLTTADGKRIPIRLSTGVLYDNQGKIAGCIESFRDLSMVEELQKQLESQFTYEDIIGRSGPMRKLFEMLPVLSDSDSTVLIEGASGTGKELVARAIHNLSPRSKKKFIAINCGALPDTLLESELFGYKKGAFTDAKQDKPGRFAVAEGGTIFLDEIGDISPAMQTRLLRVLQERVYEPLGSVTPIKTDVRIIAATNKNLHSLVQKGTFRDDLFYRIDVIRVDLPSLQDRREDIPLLIEHFIHRFNRLQDKSVVGLSDEAWAILLEHEYPGNVRELENIIEHAFVLCRGGQIEMRHLPGWLRGVDHQQQALTKPNSMTLEQMERIMIADALRRHDGNRQLAAKQLGIHPSTLFRKLRSLDIDVPEQDGRSRK